MIDVCPFCLLFNFSFSKLSLEIISLYEFDCVIAAFRGTSSNPNETDGDFSHIHYDKALVYTKMTYLADVNTVVPWCNG